MNTISFFLPVSSARLAASLTLPDDGLVRAALLIAPPLVEERKGAVLPMVEASRDFADSLHLAVLRVDYSGTGDSEGSFATADPAAWPKELAVASDWLARLVPGRPLFWMALRTGCPLAVAALPAASHRPAGFLFWDALSGAESVRQWLRRHLVNDMIAYGTARVSRADLEKRLHADGPPVDLDGFAFRARMVAGIEGFRLPAVTDSADWPDLFSLTSGHPSPELSKALLDRPSVSERQFHLPPYWNSVGYVDVSELREASREWLGERLQGIAPVPLGTDAASLPTDGADGERMVAIQSPAATIRGLFHDLPDGVSADGRAVLFLGGWSGDRKGPHRLFVRFARELASNGIPALRIDYRGRGEGDGAASDGSIRKMVEDASAAIGWLREMGHGPKGIVLVAICSGCKVAITASSEPGVAALVLWSAEAMGSLRASSTASRKTLANLGVYLRKLFRRETWRKILRGEVHTDMVGKALVRHETRSADEAKDEDRTLRTFRSFRGPLTFIYGGSDPDAPVAQAAYRRFCERHGLPATFSTIPDAGHSYYGLAWTDELLRRTKEALFRERA